MIYLISKNRNLFQTTRYKEITLDKAMEFLLPLKRVQFDTETSGLDCFEKELLTVQLGNNENQFVFDWTTLDKVGRKVIKDYLESGVLVIGVNLMFDLCFMYVNNIYPKNIYDLMVVEQVLYLGYPKIIAGDEYKELNLHLPMYKEVDGHYELSYSLKAMAERYLGIDIDKSVRGRIITEGLTDAVVEYAGNDVRYLEDILDKQTEKLQKEDLVITAQFENKFTRALAYVKYCGVHLDASKWQAKMALDNAKLTKAVQALNDWVVKWDSERTVKDGWDIQYPELSIKNIKEETEELIKNGYVRSPADDLESPNGPVLAYKKKINGAFVKVDLQGDLFSGFNDKPQCTINWSSSQQVIQLFKALGINVSTFDKKTKKKKDSIESKILKPQKDQFPIIPLFLEYQEAAKVTSTYGENWLKAINPITKRVHADLHVIGTDTSRIASGGGVYKVNILNLPRDKETRACFTAEEGNVWISSDYMGQESAITASVSNDSKMIEILTSGGDMHGETAKICWPHLLGELSIHDIKSKYKSFRQNAKSVEFAIFYGGNDDTLRINSGFDAEEAKQIYNNFMKAFSGIAKYQDYCRKAVMHDGYILMNPLTKHKSHIYDMEWLKNIQSKFNEDGFWEYYREMKRDYPTCDTVKQVSRYFKRKSDIERTSINYRIQNRGAAIFKSAMIKLFNYIQINNLINIVKLCVTPYDEINLECPKEMGEKIADVLVNCLVEGGKPFCTRVPLGADVARMNKCHSEYYINNELIMKPGDVIDTSRGILYNLTTGKSYPETKEYKDHVEDDGPLPNYWIH